MSNTAMQQPVSYMDFFSLWMVNKKVPHLTKQAKPCLERSPAWNYLLKKWSYTIGLPGHEGGESLSTLLFIKWRKSVLLSAQSLRNKWAVLKASDPPTKSGDKTVTSCGKQVRQLAGCTGCAKGFITSFPFYLAAPSLLPSGQRGYHINPGWHQALPVFACWKIRLYR